MGDTTSAEGETPNCCWTFTLETLRLTSSQVSSPPLMIIEGGIFELGLGNPWFLVLLVIGA